MTKEQEIREVIKRERDRIQLDLEEYMQGTFLEQDSIYVDLHDIINNNNNNYEQRKRFERKFGRV